MRAVLGRSGHASRDESRSECLGLQTWGREKCTCSFCAAWFCSIFLNCKGHPGRNMRFLNHQEDREDVTITNATSRYTSGIGWML